MLTRLLHGTGVAVMFTALVCAQPQTGPAGHWEGHCTLDGRQVTFTVDLAKNATSEWIASMGVPSENVTGLVVMDVAVDGNSVKFIGVELMMSRFDLTLTPDGKMKGTITNAQVFAPIEFTRAGEAHVQRISPSPAVSKELEGDWEGSLDVPGGQGFRILVHFKNQADGTVEATFANLSMGMPPVPMNDVRQTDRRVEFGLKVAHASFEGALNKEGTELVGQLVHEDNGVPLTLRKK
jgi:hypothetical protein